MDNSAIDRHSLAHLQALEQEIRLLQTDLAAAGLPVGDIADITTPAGVRRLRAALLRAYAGEEAQGAESTAELAHANQVLREREQSSRDLYNRTPVMLHSIDAEGRLVSVSDTWLAMMGYTREEVIGCRSIEFLTEASRQYARDVVLPQFFATGKTLEAEYQFVKKNGEMLDILLSAVAEFDDAGQFKRTMAVLIDITERKKADEALRQEIARRTRVEAEHDVLLHDLGVHQLELHAQNDALRSAQEELTAVRDRYSDLYHHAPVGYLTLDAGGHVIQANNTFAHLLGGMMPNVLLQQPFSRCVAHESQDDFHFFFQRLRQREESTSLELRLKKTDGTTFWAHLDAGVTRQASSREFRLTVSDITARKQAEEALCASEERYRRLFEHMTDGFVSVDIQGHILESNPAYQAMLGYTADELCHMTYHDLTPSQWHAMEARNVAEQLLPRGYSDAYEKEYRRKDGTVFPVELRTFLFRDNHGQLDGMWAIVRDITARKQAEEALKDSERRLHELAELAPIGIFLVDAGGVVTYVNERWSEITGRPSADGYGREWMIGIHPDDRAYVEREREKMFREQRESLREYRYLTPDAGLKWLIVTMRPLLDAHGAMAGFIGIVSDVTDRKHAEMRVQELLQRVEQWAAAMDATLSAIADGIIIYGPQGEITRINHAAEQLLGYTAEITALPISARLAHLRLESADGALLTLEAHPSWRALHGETISGLVIAISHDDRQRRWVSASAAPIPAPAGGILGAVTTFADITPLRELQQRQEDLLHIVSHDLRIPLTVIHGHMEILEDALQSRQLAGELAMSTSTIDRNVRRMNLMIQDLVDMARLEGQQFALLREDVLLQAFVPDLLARLTDILPMHRVVADIPPDLPPARADHARLFRQIRLV